MEAKCLVALVLSIVRGETSVAEAAHKHGLTVTEIEDWQECFAPGAAPCESGRKTNLKQKVGRARPGHCARWPRAALQTPRTFRRVREAMPVVSGRRVCAVLKRNCSPCPVCRTGGRCARLAAGCWQRKRRAAACYPPARSFGSVTVPGLAIARHVASAR